MQATNHDSLPLPSAGRAGAPAPLLPGSPARPFYSRCNARWQRLHWYSWLSLSFTATIAFRCWHLLTPPSTAWLSASAALALGDVAWRRLRPRSYARLRELPAAALTYLAFGTPATWRLMDSLLNDHSVPPAGGAHPSTGGSAGTSGSSASGAGGLGWQAALPLAGAHVARLLFASGAAKECANALSLRVRLGLSAAVQATLFLTALPYTPVLCAAQPLAHPAAQRVTGHLHRGLGGLATAAAAGVPPASAATGDVLSPASQCVAVITWLRLVLGFVVPLLVAAAAEARLWEQHQAERAAAGLAPEACGAPRAAAYRAARWLAWEGALHSAMVLWLLLSLSWHLASLAAAAGAGAAAECAADPEWA